MLAIQRMYQKFPAALFVPPFISISYETAFHFAASLTHAATVANAVSTGHAGSTKYLNPSETL